MSESVSTGGATSAAPATSSAPTSTAPATASTTSQPTGGNPAPTSGNPATPAVAARELGESDMDALITVKVNGQDKKVSLREAQKNYQIEQAAQERMRQVADERKQLQAERQKELARLKEFKTNPEKMAEFLGLDLDTFAEERLAKKYELMQMDPHQRRALELEQKLQTFEQRENQSKQGLLEQIKEVTGSIPEGADQATKEQLQAFLGHQKQIYSQESAKYQKEVAEAWLETGLPKYSSVGKDIAFQMLKAQKSGTPLQPREAAAIVKAERLSSAREIMSQMDAKAIQDFLGTELIQKLRDYDVDRVNQSKGPQFGNPQNGPGSQPASNAPRKALNQFEWRKAMGLD